MTTKTDMERILGMHDSNLIQISGALISAGQDPHEVLTQDARGFLAGLALCDIVLAAAHQPESDAAPKKARKKRGPNKAPRRARTPALDGGGDSSTDD